MAKLFKNECLSSDVILLGNQPPLPQLVEETLPPLINDSQLLESYQHGFAAGKDEGIQIADQQMSLLKQQIETSLTAIPQAIEQNRLQLNTEISDIVLLISQQFFSENEVNPKTLEQQINQLLNQLNNQQTIELHLHPQEINALQKGLIKLETTHLNGLKIKSDESLRLGGYVIKTDHGLFDASIEKQIDKLKDCLLEMRQRGQHATLD